MNGLYEVVCDVASPEQFWLSLNESIFQREEIKFADEETILSLSKAIQEDALGSGLELDTMVIAERLWEQVEMQTGDKK